MEGLIGEGGWRVHGERSSASLYGGLGARPPVGSRNKAPGRGSGGRSSPEASDIF